MKNASVALESQRRIFTPRGAALRMFKCKDPEVLMAGPAGTGKSRACLEKMHALALKNPGFRGLIARKVLASLGSTGLETWRKFVVPESMAAGHLTYYGGSTQEPPQYRYANGARVYIGGLDKASKIMSSEYDVIFIQEATELTEDDWEMLTTRLRNGAISFQQLLADCNPDDPFHWIKLRCDDGVTTMLHSKHEDNPRLFDDVGKITEGGKEYIARLDALSGVRYQRLRQGLWVAAEGVIYEEWNAAIHLTGPIIPPPSWERVWSVDFGYVNPFVMQCWAIDPKDGQLNLYREIYHTRRLVEDHAAHMLKIVRRDDGSWREPKPQSVICDHDAEDRATLERHLGLGTSAAKKTVSDGIQAVMTRLRPLPNGHVRLRIASRALVELDRELKEAGKPTCTAQEFGSYVWRDHVVKEEPVKENDHGLDALRYAVAKFDLAARPSIRWLN